MKIGVLALQGAFIEHETAFQKLGVDVCEIRTKEQFLSGVDAIILPGGESTVQSRLLKEEGIFEPLKAAIEDGLPVFGTCAGMILLAKKIAGQDNACLSVMDAEVKRNAYGRQLGSFYTESQFEGLGVVPMTFIRAPYFEKVADNVRVLAVVEGKIVAARQNNMLATAFHPELDDDLRIHEYFLQMIKKAK